MRKAGEDHHHTPDEVKDYLATAYAIVGGLEFDDDLKPLAFGKAIDLLAVKHIVYEQVMPGPSNLGRLLG